MKKSLKRRFAALSVVVLLMGLLATTAFAAYGDTSFTVHFDFVNDVSFGEAAGMKADATGVRSRLVASSVSSGLTASVYVTDPTGVRMSLNGTISSSSKTASLPYNRYGETYAGWCYLRATATKGYGGITGMWYFE